MRATTLIVLCAVLLPVSAAQAQNTRGDTSLGDAARRLRQQKAAGENSTPDPAATSLPASPSAPASAASTEFPSVNYPPPRNAEEAQISFQGEIRVQLVSENFAALEKTANTVRSEKSRFPGGIWKLFFFYEALQHPMEGGSRATDAAWRKHIELIQRWVTAYPESITARVALAQAHETYAWAARGNGWASTISEEGWKLMAERAELARQTLLDAASLKAKCPHWYFVMQDIALEQGWDKDRAQKLLEDASAFEPGYYHYYRNYANYLMPRWHGEDGEAEAFAEQMFKRIGGKEGAFVYFEIATVLNCLYCNENHLGAMSWPRIKEGYAAMEELYGTSRLKKNRFAMLTAQAGDKTAARKIFGDIGEDWDPHTWSKSEFDSAKAAATQ